MKKAIPIFLVCIFLFNTLGYFIAFKAVQYAVKNEIKFQIKSNLPITELTTITINKTHLATIEWKDNGKELIYNNEMYDVVRSNETATSITYYCIHDKKEKLLFTNLDDHINAHIITDKPVKNPASKKLADHVVKLYFETSYLFGFNNFKKHSVFSYITIIYTPALIETNSPPPEFV